MSTITLAAAINAATGVCRAILSAVSGKGQYMTAEWQTIIDDPKQGLKAEHRGVVLRKVTRAVVRTGIEYRNLGQNADTETGALKWGEWSIYPWIITHKGAFYVRIYMSSDIEESHAKYEYFVNGERKDKAEYQKYLKPSAIKEYDPDNVPPVFTYAIKECNILAVNGVRFDI